MEKFKIILVEENQLFLESMKDLVENRFGYCVVAEAKSGKEFINLPSTLKPDIILMDLWLPVIDGFTATKLHLQHYPDSKIIAVTNHFEKVYLMKLVETGFKGCIFKNRIFEDLQAAVNRVSSGSYWFKFNFDI